MRNLGRAATMAATAATALGLWGCGQAGQPGTGEASEPLGYVILDRTARQAGVHVEGVVSDDAVLPVELTPGSRQTLVGPAGRVPLEIDEDEVVYVRGRNAQLERGTLDHEVARDRISVVGSESAAHALAEDVDGVVDARGGRLVVVGPGALAGLARAAMPEGLDEVVPVAPDDAAGLPAFANIVESGDGERLTPAAALVQPFDWPGFIKSRLAEPADELLPEVVSCPDPVAGTWVSREHYPEHYDWYRFELIVRRDPRDPSSILGTIHARSWGAGAELSNPVSCEGATFDWTVRMSAAGAFDGEQVSFGGMSHFTETTRCGSSYDPRLYNNDHFTGQLVDGGRFLAAVNNDGDRAKNEPHLFRRVACN
jgi:hypothetical protein